jgi:UDP-N-acetylglucosamine 2-epimerase (hydrolysing)
MDGRRVKKILFVTGTRADFGKLKALIVAAEAHPDFEATVFVTGMHTLSLYGFTQDEVFKLGLHHERVHVFMNQNPLEPMDLVLSNTINGLSRYVREFQPDMILVHGDRVEALAGAIVGGLNNVLVAHVEGGELSGTVDDHIRHSVTKLSHLHFVANDEAAARLRQLGEDAASIFVIGSPDMDLMLKTDGRELPAVKAYYEIAFDEYALAVFHPVTTECDTIAAQAETFFGTLAGLPDHYVAVYPNNDLGGEDVLRVLQGYASHPRFRIFPSIRFEWFLTLLWGASYIVGNSSAGIREAPFFGVPVVNVGTRQHRRSKHKGIINVPVERGAIVQAIAKAKAGGRYERALGFGDGSSTERFVAVLERPSTWSTPRQKVFVDFAED